MIKLVKYDNETTYMFPSGKIATPEVMRAEFPAITVFPHVLQVSGNVCQAVMELEAMRAMHNIDGALSEAEAIAAIEAKLNAEPAEPEPSAEERIAAALEYQNLISM